MQQLLELNLKIFLGRGTEPKRTPNPSTRQTPVVATRYPSPPPPYRKSQIRRCCFHPRLQDPMNITAAVTVNSDYGAELRVCYLHLTAAPE